MAVKRSFHRFMFAGRRSIQPFLAHLSTSDRLVMSTLLAKSCDADKRNALVRNGLYHAALDVVCNDSAHLVHADEINLELLLLAMQVARPCSALIRPQ